MLSNQSFLSNDNFTLKFNYGTYHNVSFLLYVSVKSVKRNQLK
jgi:hypothetical protein